MSQYSRFILNGSQQALRTTAVLLLLCGLGFPLLITGLGALLFPWQSQGSPLEVDGQVVGCEHIGQEFTADCYLHGRPSAYHYNTYYEREDGTQFYNDETEFGGLASGSNNYAPSNPLLSERIRQDAATFVEENPQADRRNLPTELFTASGSGMDPHISPRAAEAQIPRIVAASDLTEMQVRDIIHENTEPKAFGIFGEKAVNVLHVNIDIYEAYQSANSVQNK